MIPSMAYARFLTRQIDRARTVRAAYLFEAAVAGARVLTNLHRAWLEAEEARLDRIVADRAALEDRARQ